MNYGKQIFCFQLNIRSVLSFLQKSLLITISDHLRRFKYKNSSRDVKRKKRFNIPTIHVQLDI